MTETITITNYSPARFLALQSTLSEKGLKLIGEDGEAKDHGADVKFHYDHTTQILTLEILHGPHLHDFQTFCNQVNAFVTAQPDPSAPNVEVGGHMVPPIAPNPPGTGN